MKSCGVASSAPAGAHEESSASQQLSLQIHMKSCGVASSGLAGAYKESSA